jgi:hypothetical protein
MGSDFDVDKFYTNTFATYYDKATGKLTKLDQSYITKKDALIEELATLTRNLKALNKYKRKKKDSLVAALKEDIKNLKIMKYKIKDLDILVLDNEITAIKEQYYRSSKEVELNH